MNLPSFDFTNWREHPSDNRFEVFFFESKKEGDYFEQLLSDNGIKYESYVDESEPKYQFFYATKKIDSKQVINLNHLTIGQFRSRFISNSILRYALVIAMLIIMGLAIIGYLKAN